MYSKMVEGMCLFIALLWPTNVTDLYLFKQAKRGKYPVLASLVCDYLATLGSSAAAKQTFSAAVEVCASDQGRLSSVSIERLVGGGCGCMVGFP